MTAPHFGDERTAVFFAPYIKKKSLLDLLTPVRIVISVIFLHDIFSFNNLCLNTCTLYLCQLNLGYKRIGGMTQVLVKYCMLRFFLLRDENHISCVYRGLLFTHSLILEFEKSHLGCWSLKTCSLAFGFYD